MARKPLKTSFLFFLILITTISHLFAQIVAISPEYLSIVNQKVQTFINYPQEALEQGWEGIVKVKFVINQDGQITDIYIAESSGYPLLDAAAMFAVQDASPYPFPNEYRDLGEVEILLPITYIQPGQGTEQAYYQPQTYAKESEPSLYFSQPLPSEPATDYSGHSTPLQRSLYGIQQPEAYYPAKDKPSTETGPQTSYQEIIPMNMPDELRSFVELALQNNQPTQVAKEEIQLAQIKVTEAQRNFLPNMKVAGYNTVGDVYKVDYEEREVKLQLDQPFYYSGRLENSLNQAKINLEITHKNYDRIKVDVMHKTETSYYNLVAAKMHLDQKYSLRQEAEELLGKLEKLAEGEMITSLELISAKSWFEQLKLQIESIRHELFMAEVAFKQVLNVKDMPDIKTESIEASRLDTELDSLINIALEKRPEVYLSDLLVKFNDYGQKVEKSKGKPAVDFVTSYGFYQGHYKTEPWKDSSNWYAGVKASIPWETSTLNTSATTENSKPRFGQTSPTGSSTISAELGIMDNFKRISDKKKVDIELQRSLSDYNETTKTIAFEVQDAFLNYRKALIQLDTTQAEMKFRRNEAEVTKVRSMVGDASLSNAMESLYNFSEAQTKYFSALANCQISLVNLKKACGYGIKI
jgi:TonB family protein